MASLYIQCCGQLIYNWHSRSSINGNATIRCNHLISARDSFIPQRVVFVCESERERNGQEDWHNGDTNWMGTGARMQANLIIISLMTNYNNKQWEVCLAYIHQTNWFHENRLQGKCASIFVGENISGPFSRSPAPKSETAKCQCTLSKWLIIGTWEAVASWRRQMSVWNVWIIYSFLLFGRLPPKVRMWTCVRVCLLRTRKPIHQSSIWLNNSIGCQIQ